MSIQINGLGRNQMGGPMGGNMMGQNPMMQMLQMLMSIMMMFMQGGMGGQMGGNMGGMSPGMNPGFGGPSGIPGNNSGGIPGFNSFGGNPGGHSPGAAGNLQGAPNNGLIGRGQGGSAVDWASRFEGVSESNNPGLVRQFSRGRWQAWCADFVSQAYKNSPGGSPFGHQSSVAGILGWGSRNRRFFGAGAAARNPQMLKVGDIAVWKSNGRSHVGLVTGINQNGTFSTIEGNTGNAVRRRTHSFGRGLTGFVRPRGQMPGQ